MNITDFLAPEYAGDRLHLIFARQAELMEKYHTIEAKNGLLQTPHVPVFLDDPNGQARLKDFAWRVTEEVAEALDALLKDESIDHVQEELVDALHFLVEMAIISGIGPSELLFRQEIAEGDCLDALWNSTDWEITNPLSVSYLDFIRKLGMTCHTLKNKPWKVTQMLTDRTAYRERFVSSFKAFIGICRSHGMSSQQVFDLYFRKSEVNKFRQRSNY